ncbi:MAG: low-specificity L-threonine aldolase [Clostridiales bacterium]|nr:low-specificity L-threonine aldolase [Clostridiales bacterium]
MKYLDFRSDTVTLPTEKMRKAMAGAIVGDDVYGDDPTVNKLEELAASLLGKEAALFVPSGTFANQVAILTHTNRGDEIIIGHDSHIIMHEVGAAAVIAGVQLNLVNSDLGHFDISELEKKIRSTEDIHYPTTGLICVENAHGSGKVVSLENMKEIYELAKKKNIPVHLDGARIFNAAVHLGVHVKEIAKYADTINVCLSKGLGAPIGSLVVGGKDFISRARKNRKLMGGGMRQAGIIAAAGIIALEEMTERLKEDHGNAKYMADLLSKIEGIEIIWDRLDINMVFFKIEDGLIEEEKLVNRLLERGIKVNGMEDDEYRFVTHLNTSRESIDKLCSIVKELLTN